MKLSDIDLGAFLVSVLQSLPVQVILSSEGRVYKRYSLINLRLEPRGRSPMDWHGGDCADEGKFYVAFWVKLRDRVRGIRNIIRVLSPRVYNPFRIPNLERAINKDEGTIEFIISTGNLFDCRFDHVVIFDSSSSPRLISSSSNT